MLAVSKNRIVGLRFSYSSSRTKSHLTCISTSPLNSNRLSSGKAVETRNVFAILRRICQNGVRADNDAFMFDKAQKFWPNQNIADSNLVSVDPNQMTVILTHGWIPLMPAIGNPIFSPNGIDSWPVDMTALLRAQGFNGNIVAWNWPDTAKSSVIDPKQAGGQSPRQGILLGKALLRALGASYFQPIHFIGHSFGTLVNAYAANYLQGTNFACEEFSPSPWPAANMHLTLFDEAEAGTDKDFTLNSSDLAALADANTNLLLPSSYFHPLPNEFCWADNYISAVGILQPNAVNVILTNGFPEQALTPFSWLKKFGMFHSYPMSWYEETIQTDVSTMGFRWSFEKGGWFSQAPKTNSVYLQSGLEWNLTPINWDNGVEFLNSRFQTYRGKFINSAVKFSENVIAVTGIATEQAIWIPPLIDWQINLYSSRGNLPVHLKSKGDGTPERKDTVNVTADAWAQIVIPANAVSMSFNYQVQGNWHDDSLAAALDGTNVLFLPGRQIETNIVFSSGSIDVSAYAGHTNEFFVGIIGGTSTNAQLMVENLTFTIPIPPVLQAQAYGDNIVLSWPISAQNFSLQTTTNLNDPHSWVSLTNVVTIMNLKSIVTNRISQMNQFYRLVNQ